MDITFQGLVPAEKAPKFVTLNFHEDWVTKKGDAHGPVVFLNTYHIDKDDPCDEHKDVNAAIMAAKASDMPKGTKTYVNGSYMTLAQAAKLDIQAYVYKREGKVPGWKIQWWTDDAAFSRSQVTKRGRTAKPTAKRTKKSNARLY